MTLRPITAPIKATGLKVLLVTAASAMGLAGCANPSAVVRSQLAQQLERAQADVPTRWRQAEAAEAPARTLPERWWTLYEDPALNQLVAFALAHSPDIRASAQRLRLAALRAETSGDPLRPGLNGSADTSVSKALRPPEEPIQTRATTVAQRSWSSSWGASWELDLWGRLRLQHTMADWEQQASHDDDQGLRASLAAQIARQYWQLAASQQRIEHARASLEHAQGLVELVRVRQHAGAASGLERIQSEASLGGQRSALLRAQQSREEQLQGLSVLLGLPPGQLPPGLRAETWRTDYGDIFPIPAGLPAEVLARRPDLRAAEQRLRATLAAVEVARLTFYPGIRLTGGLGTSGAALAQVLANPVANLGAQLSLPFLNAAEMRRAPKVAEAEHAIALQGFRQALLRALSEVENLLLEARSLDEQGRQQAVLLSQQRRIESLSELRYRAGADALRIWLDAAEARRQAELAVLETRLAQRLNQAQLWLALGAGTGEERTEATDLKLNLTNTQPDASYTHDR
ncbi:MAG: efflux transporter outer membrane subunit [Candidatus Competibacteraceae bacterium]|nr:efflux transporter outer membrane subunit [Candidatus Competibacteraceae bacterium]